MSRHRDVRCMNYNDEYDGYDDVYGHSVEDDYCVSPSAEQFMFDRSKQANISSFFTEPDIVEDNEEAEEMPSSYKLPQLSELDMDKLMSCIEAIKNVIGDTHPESELNRKIIEFNYNTEAVLNAILNNDTVKKEDKQPTEKSFTDTQSDSKFERLLSGNSNQSMSNQRNNEKSNKAQECSQEEKSLETESNLSPSLSSLAALSAHHLKMSEKKFDSPSFAIPKLSFNCSKTLPTKSEVSSFNSLADLTDHHLKISNEYKNDSAKNLSSLSGFIIPNMASKNSKPDKFNLSSFDSLAELTAHHLKISTKTKDDSVKDISSPSGFTIPKLTSNDDKSDKFNKPTFSSLADLTAHHLKTKKNTDLPSSSKIPELTMKIESEKDCKDNIPQNISNSILEDISNLNLEKKLDSSRYIKTEVEAPKMNNEMRIMKENIGNMNCNTHSGNQSNKSMESKLDAIRKECIINSIIYSSCKLLRKAVSPFGKVICKSYKRKMPSRRKETIQIVGLTHHILRFDFSSPSPDSIVLLKRLKPIA